MSEHTTVNLPKEIWDRYKRLAEKKQVESNALIEKVLVAYLNNEETEDGVECNVNWLGFGTVEPC